MPQRNKNRMKNAKCIPHKPSKRNLVLKKNRKLRSKAIGKKKSKKKFLKINFFRNGGKLKKKGIWFNESEVFLDTFRFQDYEYLRCNSPCLKCCKCEFITSRMKCLHKHSTKHYELDTPTRTLELRKPILKCSYCPHVHTKLTDLLKHVEYVHLEKKDYKKNKIDTLNKRLKDIYVDIKKLKLEISALNLCNESDETDNLLENGNIDERKANVSEDNSSESSDISSNLKTNGFKSSSKVLKRSYSSVCNSISSEVQLIPDDNDENFHTKTKFVSGNTSPKKSLDQQLKLDIHFEKTQQNKSTFDTNTNFQQKNSRSKNSHTACTICSTKFPSIEELEGHKQSDAHDEMTFLCPTCSRVFSNLKDLRQHRGKTKHKKIKLLCSVCLTHFPSKFQLDFHTKSTKHKLVNKFPKGSALCVTCNSIFSSKTNLDQHVLNNHTGSANSISSLSNSTNETKNTLDQQKANSKHEIKNHLCTICLNGFNSKAQLKAHMKKGVHEVVESSIRRMVTKTCLQPSMITEQKPESQFINLRQLLSNNEQKNITCTLCLRQFATEENLTHHMENDSHNSLLASVNDITLAGQTPKNDIQQHINNKQKHKTLFPTHEVAVDDNLQKQPITNAWGIPRNIFSVNESTKVSEYSESATMPRKVICTLCNREFAAEVSLKQHMENAHISLPASVHDVKPQLETAAPKIIMCTICQKEFAAEIDLEQHMNSNVIKHKNASSAIHEVAADKNLQKQSITNAGQETRNIFSVNESVKVSEYSESATKPRKIICTLCNREFAAEVSLKQHMENAHISLPASVHDVKPQLETAAPKIIMCTICQKEFAAKIDLEQHMNSNVIKHKNASSAIHEVAAYKNLQEQEMNNAVQKLENIFSPSKFTDVGQDSGKNKPKTITCTVCCKQFTAAESLKQHMENAHKSQSASVQHITSNKHSLDHDTTFDEQKLDNFETSSEFNDIKPQLKTAANQKIVCTICQKEFKTKKDFEQHMNSNVLKHKNASSAKHEVAVDKSLQDNHIQELEKIFSPSKFTDVGQDSGKNKPKTITCTVCCKQFTAAESLKQHMENAHKSHSASVQHITSNKNSLDHDTTLDEQKTVNFETSSEFNDIKPQLKTAANQKIVCTICQKEFKAKKDFEQHMNSNVLKHKNASSAIHEVAVDKSLQDNHIQELEKIFSPSKFTDVGQDSGKNKPKTITCTVCCKQFTAEESLKQHMEDAHKSHSASVQHITSNKNSLDHDTTLDEQKTVNFETSSEFNDIKPQLKTAANQKIVCTICQKEFKAKKDFEQHMNSNVLKHKNASSAIHEVAVDKSLQDNHIQELEKIFSPSKFTDVGQDSGKNKPKTITCTVCCKQFTAEESLKQHMEDAHKSQSASVQQITSNKNSLDHDTTLDEQKTVNFESSSEFNDIKPQLKTAANQKIVCTICQKEFKAKKDFEQHMNSNVLKHKNASSAIHEVAVDKSLQDNHIQELQKIFSPSKFTDVGQDSGKNKPKTITCTVCCKQFTAAESLKQHMENAHKSHSASVQHITSNKNSLDHDTTFDERKLDNFETSSEFNDIKLQLKTAANQKIVCTICQKEFKAKKDFEQHMNSNVLKHKNASSAIHEVAVDKSLQEQPIDNGIQELENIFSPSKFTDVGQDSRNNKPKTITCTVCCKQFTSAESLKQHMENAHKSHSASVQHITSNKNSLDHDTTFDERKPDNFETSSEFNDIKPQLKTAANQKIVCTICQKEFKAKKDFEQHMNSNVLKHKNASSAIHEVAVDKSLQDNHIQELEKIFSSRKFTDVGQDSGKNKPKTITCTVCCKQFTAAESLKQHMENAHKSHSASVQHITSNKNSLDHDTTLDERKLDNFESSSKFNDIKPQLKTAANQKIVCTICQREFRAKQDLEQHMKSNVIKHKTASVPLHEQRKITCTLCKKQFLFESCLKQHMRSSAHKTVPSSTFGFPIDKYHNNQEQENISFCDVQSKSTNILNQDSGSSGHKKYKCTLCQKQFVAAKDLQQHTDSNVHETKSICCTVCGSKFSTLKSLENHLRSTKHQLIECSVCRRTFVSKNALDEHLENSKIHKEITALVETATEHSSLSYICKLCNNSFESKNLLDQHMADGHYLVFTCNMCLQEFESTQDVVQHIQSVHQIGNYFCPICDKMFNYDFSLNNHMKSTGHAYLESVCTICFATFSSENALKQHLENTSHKYVNRY